MRIVIISVSKFSICRNDWIISWCFWLIWITGLTMRLWSRLLAYCLLMYLRLLCTLTMLLSFSRFYAVWTRLFAYIAIAQYWTYVEFILIIICATAFIILYSAIFFLRKTVIITAVRIPCISDALRLPSIKKIEEMWSWTINFFSHFLKKRKINYKQNVILIMYLYFFDFYICKFR